MDTLTPKQRSERMSRIRSKDTKPEIAVRTFLHRLGYRYRIHSTALPGKPDIVFPSRKKVILVHGCFWHGHEGCRTANQPKSRSEFWQDKFTRNQKRDLQNLRLLKKAGWRSLVVWECETKDMEKTGRRLQRFLGERNSNVSRK